MVALLQPKALTCNHQTICELKCVKTIINCNNPDQLMCNAYCLFIAESKICEGTTIITITFVGF